MKNSSDIFSNKKNKLVLKKRIVSNNFEQILKPFDPTILTLTTKIVG
jgi:hypothetical protein